MAEIPHKVNSLTINNINVISESFDPRTFGYISPIGSLFIDTNGNIYKKFGVNNIDWELISPKNVVKLISVNYSALRDDSILLINTNSSDLIITLPQIGFKSILNIKKISNNNKIIINPFSSELIDGKSQLILTQNNSNVNLVSNGTNWYIL